MLIPDGFAQVNYVFGGQAAPTGAEVTLGLDVSTVTADDDVFSQAVAQAFATNVLNHLSPAIQLVEVRIKFGPNSTGRTVIAPVGTNGGGAGAPETPQSAVLVKKNTNSGGRAGRGRMYIPGAGQDTFGSDGLMNTETAGYWQDWVEEWWLDLIAADAVPVLLHGPGSPISAPSPITSFVVDPRAATQRRRVRR